MKKPHKTRKLIRAERVFHGMPVQDSITSMLVQPTEEDITNSVRGDPENCAYANCVKRMTKARVVFVYHTVAYVEALDGAGNSVLLRYIIRDGTKEYLEKIDDGEAVQPAGFTLKAPTYSQTLDYRAALRKDQRKRGKEAEWAANRKRKLAREKKTGKKIIRRRIVASQTVGSFRDGTGCVRFLGLGDAGRLEKHQF